jgi:hypothetical protein
MKKNYLMEIIREEISSYLGENEPMYDSPQTQQREVYSMLDHVEELKKMRDNLNDQIAQLEATAHTFNVNEAGLFGLKDPKNATKGFASTIDPDDATEKSPEFQSKYKKLSEEEQLDEETLNEMPFIGGEKGAELFTAIKSASEKLKNQFPDATAKDISKIILSKKKRPELAPEVEDALMAQEEKYGDDPKYTANLGGPQTEKAVAKALGEYEPGQRGRKATEKPAAEPKSKSFNKTPITKKNYEPKPVNDLTDDEGNPIEIDTTLKTATGNKELEDKLKDVIAKKKAKLAKAEGADYDREVAALKQFLAKPEIAKYIAKKTVNGVNPYSINNILK